MSHNFAAAVAAPPGPVVGSAAQACWSCLHPHARLLTRGHVFHSACMPCGRPTPRRDKATIDKTSVRLWQGLASILSAPPVRLTMPCPTQWRWGVRNSPGRWEGHCQPTVGSSSRGGSADQRKSQQKQVKRGDPLKIRWPSLTRSLVFWSKTTGCGEIRRRFDGPLRQGV